MVSLTKFVVVLLLVALPCLLADELKKSNSCQMVSVSATLTSSSSSRYNTYAGIVRNAGSSTVSNIKLTSSASLREVDGLNESDDNEYTLSDQQSLEAGETFSFTYQVRKQTNVNWSVSCSAVTVAPSKSTTKAPTTTRAPTTRAPTTTKATTTRAPTTTKATTTRAPTTKAPTTTRTPTTTKATTTAAAPVKVTTTAANAPNTGATNANTGGKTCSSGWWVPGPSTTWQWQLTGTVDTSLDVQMYDIDLFDVTPALINTLHAKGKTVICYFSTQYENWRPDAAAFPASALGSNLDDWAGERYVDIRSPAIRAAMSARLDLAVSKGCDGVEPDNVDGYQASTGFPIKAADQIDYNTYLANQAHARGLSIGLKNDGDQASQLVSYFDWALNEQCNQYSECSAFNVFINAGKAVFNCEYSGSASSVCPKMVTAKFSTLFKKLALDASVSANCCTYAPGGCAKAAYKCTTNSKRSVEDEEPIPTSDENTAQDEKMSGAAGLYARALALLGL